jgi:antitoxin PrlF
MRNWLELTVRLKRIIIRTEEAMATFSGSITTTGKSEAIRLDKALFRLHPEFRQKAKVRAQVIAPGQALISVVSEGPPEPDEPDPIMSAFLGFLEKDMKADPKRITGLSKRSIGRARQLTKGVKVRRDERLPNNVSF